MAEVVAGLLTSAVVDIAANKIKSAITEQASSAVNFSDDLKDMEDTMESISAVLKDAEKRSVKEESVRLWLKRLKYAAVDISVMMDDYQDTDTKVSIVYFTEVGNLTWQAKQTLENLGRSVAAPF